ncbi:MAG: hypothetical protein IJ702_10090, partial [Fretibacterium sp.]|nr:hypothetical protein [Fretibacterium sp.]
MRTSFKRTGVALCLCLCLFSAAWAAAPEDALSAQPKESVYFALRVEDLGGLLRWALSEENLRTFAPLAGLDEDTIQIVNLVLKKVAVKAAALSGGTTAEGVPFFQAALAGSGANVVEFLLGPDSPMAPVAESILNDSGLTFELKDGLL